MCIDSLALACVPNSQPDRNRPATSRAFFAVGLVIIASFTTIQTDTPFERSTSTPHSTFLNLNPSRATRPSESVAMQTPSPSKRKMSDRDGKRNGAGQESRGYVSDYGPQDEDDAEMLHAIELYENPDGTPKEGYASQTSPTDPQEGPPYKRPSSGSSSENLRQRAIDSVFFARKPTSLSDPRKQDKASKGERPSMEEMFPDLPGAPAKQIFNPPQFSSAHFKHPGDVNMVQARESSRRKLNKHTPESRDPSFDSSTSQNRVLSSAESASNKTSFTAASTSSQEAVKSFQRAEDPARVSTSSKAMDYHVRDLPKGGLFCTETTIDSAATPVPMPAERLHTKLERASSRVRYECIRMMGGLQLPANFLDEADVRSLEDYDLLWKRMESFEPKNLASFPKCSPQAWSHAESNINVENSANVCRTASLTFRDGTKRKIFKLILQPLRYERSCRFFRKFGSDRFLKVSLPSRRNEDLPGYLKTSGERISGKITEWLSVPDKEFMGCNWSVFCVKPHKDRKSKKKSSHQDSGSRGADVFLFATEGPGMRTVTIGELLEWFMPMRTNHELPACKAFARIELGLSKTIATLKFRPGQVIEIGDTVADGEPEDEEFNDEEIIWTDAKRFDPRRYDPKVIMNDGCARISSAAAKKVWELLQEPGSCASIFQARIGPWKGIWMVSPPEPGKEDHIWIEVTHSQRKFQRHSEDSDDLEFDEHRLTFEVLQWSHKPTSNCLHGDYLPILEDRGVPRERIDEFVRHVLDKEKDKLQQSLASPQTLYKWIEDRFGSSNEFEEEESTIQASTEISQVIKLLLGSGFNFRDFRYLQHLVKALASDWFKRVSAELKFPVDRSTTVFGVADPLDVLKPGEVHLGFSGTLGDSGDILLHGIDALVGRHPSCRRSDLQKVKMVYQPKLRHLIDVVVFPRRGKFPLAGKLQGGDYDGDKFWVCWEPALVGPFKNAPAPRLGANPEELGIKVDKTPLGGLVDYDTPRPLARFLSHVLRFTMKPALLGIVTNMHTNVCYSRNSISSDAIDRLSDLHDLLVDSAKNGYTFDWNSWFGFQRSLGITDKDRDTPMYKSVNKKTLFEEGIPHNINHVIDHIIFKTSRGHAQKIIAQINGINTDATPVDNDVEASYKDAMDSGDGKVLRSLDAAKKEMEKTFKIWKTQNSRALQQDRFSTPDATNTRFREAIREAVASYQRISVLEEDKQALESSGWLRKLGGRPTPWALLKASLLFQMFRDKQGKGVDDFIFKCDGINICDIKAYSSAGQRPTVTVPAIHNQMRMRKVKSSLSYEGSFKAGSFDFGGSQEARERPEPEPVQAMGHAEMGSLGEHNDDGNDTELDEDL